MVPDGLEGRGECSMGEEKGRKQERASANEATIGQRCRRRPEGERLYKLREEARRGGADWVMEVISLRSASQEQMESPFQDRGEGMTRQWGM